MTEDEQSLIRQRIEETTKEMASISYRRKLLEEEFLQLDLIYMGLWKFKNSLERKLIKPKIIRTRVPASTNVLLTPLDEAQAMLAKMNAEQIRELLAELQGSEEEGKEIEYKDENEVNLIEENEGEPNE